MIQLFRRKALFILLLILFPVSAFTQTAPKIDHGIIDLRQWDLSTQKIALVGYWNFYKDQLITDTRKSTAELIYFPEVWATSEGKQINYATYSVTILLPQSTTSLAVEIPQLYSAYTLYVNGKLIAQNGKTGISKESTIPQWKPQVISFSHTSDTLEFVLQITNFHHFHGGAKQPIFLGVASKLARLNMAMTRSNIAEFFMLFVLGVAFFIIYYVRQERKKITLYFSLLCISWAIRSVFSNNYLSISYLPDFDWTWMVRIEYITLFSMLIWSVLFLSRLFPHESSKIIKYIFVGINCVFIGVALVTTPAFFTQWINIYLLITALMLIHSLVITIRALIRERTGVWYLVTSIVLGILLFSYDVFVFEGFFQYYNALLFSVGYIVMFFLLGIALFYHLKIFRGDGSSGTLTFDDLYGSESLKKRS